MLLATSLAAQTPAHWPVAAKPVTIIGIDDGTPEQELDHVSGAMRLPDGHVVVANGKPLELRVYDATGRFVRGIGRRGDGPGEFRGRTDFLPAGSDSNLVYDQGSRHVSSSSARRVRSSSSGRQHRTARLAARCS